MQDESDNDALPPRKLARGESPLKGAAGRRLDANRRTRDGQPTPQMQVQSLPTGIMFMLQIIPGAKNYDIAKFSPERMVELLRGVDLSRADLTQPGRMF